LLHWIANHARTLTVAAGTLAAPAALAQQPPVPPGGDLLDQTRRMQIVAAQQIEAEVRLGLADANRLAASDRPQAVEKYKQLLTQLQNDKALTEERRTALVRQVQDRLRAAEANAVADDAAARKAASDAARQAAADQKSAEHARVKQGIDAVAGLRREGKFGEAQRQARELLQNYPDNVAVKVLNGISTAADAAGAEQAVRQEKDQRLVGVMRDNDRAALPPVGDIEFPKDWREKSERRLKSTRLSEEELRVLQALAKPIPADFKSAKLQDVIEIISNATGRTINLDKSALEEGQVTYETPVTFSARTPVATRTLLRTVLNQVGLTYVVRDNVIQVTTPSRAKDMMVTKTYYIGDLVNATGLFGGAPQWGPALDQAQLAQNVNAVIEMITSSIDPMSWQGKGGFGSIGFNVPTMSLIIRQSAENHAMLRGGLYR
jgi:hypothetical protein